ncbi:hypothetical protein EV182_005567, partial [Spiromyces aspiralis]
MADTPQEAVTSLDELLRILSARLEANNEQMAARLEANNEQMAARLDAIDNRVRNLDNRVREVESHHRAFPPGVATPSRALVTTPPARAQTTAANPPPMHTPLPAPHQAMAMPLTTPVRYPAPTMPPATPTRAFHPAGISTGELVEPRKPTDLPLYRPRGKEKENVYTDAENFIEAYEIILDAYRIEKDTYGVRWLPAHLAPDEYRNLANRTPERRLPPSWERTRQLFVDTFAPPVAPYQHLQELSTIRFRPKDDIIAFINRFDRLRTKAELGPHNKLAVEAYYQALPKDLRNLVLMQERGSRPRKPTIQELYRWTQEAYADYCRLAGLNEFPRIIIPSEENANRRRRETDGDRRANSPAPHNRVREIRQDRANQWGRPMDSRERRLGGGSNPHRHSANDATARHEGPMRGRTTTDDRKRHATMSWLL